MERLISIIVALCFLAVFVFWMTSDKEVTQVEGEEVIVEKEVLDAVKPVVIEEKKDETATLKSLFKQEGSVQKSLLADMNQELANLALNTGQYVVGVIAERDSLGEIADYEDVKWLGLEDLPKKSCVSGTVLRSDGYIVTTFKAVAGANKIRVSVARGLMKKAVLVGADPYSNLAVLKVEAEPLVEVVWGDVNRLRHGELIMCVASGINFRRSFLSGVVSGKQRESVIGDGVSYEDFIQLDLPQVFGSDGAPVVNAKGEIIGIHASVRVDESTKSGFAYAISSDLVRFVTESIFEERFCVAWSNRCSSAEINRSFGKSL